MGFLTNNDYWAVCQKCKTIWTSENEEYFADTIDCINCGSSMLVAPVIYTPAEHLYKNTNEFLYNRELLRSLRIKEPDFYANELYQDIRHAIRNENYECAAYLNRILLYYKRTGEKIDPRKNKKIL